ncbi:MAG: C40 family peptidase [Clostridia bacterium]|nr:C40 family peptidase [Clostridia bacterium]
MKKTKKFAAALAAVAAAVTLGGCVAPNIGDGNDKIDGGIPPEEIEIPSEQLPGQPPEDIEIPSETPKPEEQPPAKPEIPVPQTKKISYLNVTADGVNIRSGAGTGYSARGTAQKSTMYAADGKTDGWYKTGYKNKSAYISSKYCKLVEMEASEDERIEAVIAEGTKLLGTAYVFGAVRYHDGNGRLLKNFTTSEFDCSSLMQYIFYKGAYFNLQVNTRTQIYQGKTVKKSELKRGDLMFFTNESRKNNVGVERVGHVALYLGDNWILHTASDFAKIEQISAKRWSYFIQGQRIF